MRKQNGYSPDNAGLWMQSQTRSKRRGEVFLLESTRNHNLTLSVANQAMKYADRAGHLTGELTDNQGRRWLVMWTNGGCESSFPLSLGAPRPIYRDENGTTIHDVDFKNSQPYHRKLSLTLQLSDPKDYTGGEFEFESEIEPLPPQHTKKGTVLVFPSFYKHQVKPVTSGTRHSLVTWVEGPHWR